MKINVQAANLRWARERIGLSTKLLAQKMGVKEDKVDSWEESGELTLAQAETLATITHTPFGYLFLTEPPADELPIADFRIPHLDERWKPSTNLLDVVYDAMQVQDWYKEYLIGAGAQPLTFVGSITVSQDRSLQIDAANLIRDAVGWGANLGLEKLSRENALSRRIEAVEDAGILVMRTGIVSTNTHRPLSVSEFRGFALSDDYAPLVFINGKDADAAKLFTLAHELVHIALGISGVSNLNKTYSPDIEMERFCNAVAAEILVPLSALRRLNRETQSATELIGRASRDFKVSSLVIIRRMRDAGILTEEEFQQSYTDELGQIVQRNSNQGDSNGGNFYATTRARFGTRFLSALMAETLEGRTSYRDALRILGIKKPETLRKLASEIGVLSQWLTS